MYNILLSLIRVINYSYWSFAFIFSVANGSFTVQNYPDLAVEYEERLGDFSAQNQADPFFDSDVKELEKICNKIGNSKMFLMTAKGKTSGVSTIYPEKNESESAEVPNDFDSNAYQRMSVNIEPRPSERQIDVNLFPCPRKMNGEFWYFSYGFVHNLVYIFNRTYRALEIEFFGLAEARPSLSASLMTDGRELERYFVNAMTFRGTFMLDNNRAGQSQTPPIPDEEPLCWLNVNQQFRLCCQVASALRDDERMEINRESFHVHNCERRHLFLREISENGSAYPGGDMFVNSITCGDQSTPNFFIVSDPRAENSVFVVRNSAEILKGKRGEQVSQFQVVVGHVSNISVLQYAKYFY